MTQSGSHRVLTTHVGRLGHPDALFEKMIRAEGHPAEDQAFPGELRTAVAEVVREQVELGIDIVNDGELGKLGWQVYYRDRLSGFAAVEQDATFRPFRKGGRDAQEFAEFFATASDSWTMKRMSGALRRNRSIVCNGPIRYVGHQTLREDIDNVVGALRAVGKGPGDGFLNATSPGSILALNEHYPNEEEYLHALAAALSEEYKAITDAGLMLQIDDPVIAVHWAEVGFDSLRAYHAWTRPRIEALNMALRDVPREQVRVHICWGSYRGPHTTDLPMADLIPLALSMRVGGWSIEAANARHEHEFTEWKGIDLDGRVILPGVVSHVTDTIEHPDLVAWRIGLWADAVGRENIIASTDCGLGDRTHPQIERAKLRALVAGARIATRSG